MLSVRPRSLGLPNRSPTFPCSDQLHCFCLSVVLFLRNVSVGAKGDTFFCFPIYGLFMSMGMYDIVERHSKSFRNEQKKHLDRLSDGCSIPSDVVLYVHVPLLLGPRIIHALIWKNTCRRH